MILNDNTLAVLKNFSQLNTSLLFKEGNVLRTISPNKTVMAKAVLDQDFERDFAIYDLPRFLGVLSLLDDPNIELGAKEAKIVSGKRKIVYVYADPSTFATPPSKDLPFPEPEIEFTLEDEDIQKALKASSVLQLPELAFNGTGSEVHLRAVDSRNPTADSFSIAVAESGYRFNAIFKKENIRLLPGNYECSISSKGIAQLKSDRVTYWIASEATSTFES